MKELKRHGLTPETIARIEENRKHRRISKNENTFCKKSRCLKQINPHAEDPKMREVYWDDLPFIRDENVMACYLCDCGVTEI